MTVAGTDAGDVTVVIPTRDRWDRLGAAVASALGQQDVDVRVVVVDDGSLAAAPAALSVLTDPAVTVLRHTPARGVSAARNRGLALVQTPWVAFLDDDDWWRPDHLAGMLAAARTAGGADLVYSGFMEMDDSGRVLRSRSPAIPREPRLALLASNFIGSPAFVLLRTDVVRDLDGFDEGLAVLADWELWLRVALSGAKVAACDALSAAYVQHDSNLHRRSALTLRELRAVAARYAGAAAAHAVTLPGADFWIWIAAIQRANGERLPAARSMLRAFRTRRRAGDLARGMGLVLGEPAMRAGARVVAARRHGAGGPVPATIPARIPAGPVERHKPALGATRDRP